MGVSGKKPRYSAEQKQQAVRLVRRVREETGDPPFVVVRRVAGQLGIGVESLRVWAKQADIDEGVVAGVTSVEQRRIRDLEQENFELRRANELLKKASAFFAAELDRPLR